LRFHKIIAAAAVFGTFVVSGAETKRTASNAKSSPAKKTRTSANRTAASSRQRTPTPERYMEIQQALAERGYLTGPATGIWGPDSVDALKHFQADQNLTVDGKIGALSLIALGLGPKREPMASVTGKPERGQ
jgi:peptidoglycan hydrolase-like protein with peptidoglycan-binding domain